jgi:hypothetical protein
MRNSNYIKLYEVNSIPLKEAEDVTEGEVVYSSTGKCFECIGYDSERNSIFEQIHESELIDGEMLENIEDNFDLLSLFWKLSNKRLDKVKQHESRS